MFVNFLVSIVIASVFALGFFGLRNQSSPNFSDKVSSLINVQANNSSVPKTGVVAAVAPDFEGIKRNVSEYIQKNYGKYGVYFEDLETESGWGVNETQQFTAASTMKVLAVVGLYKRAEEGAIDLDDGVGGVSFREYARLALEVSDNNAWDVINSTVGFDYLQSMADEIGMKDTDATVNTTTAADFALLLKGLYRGSLLNNPDTQEVLSFMRQTETETRIPAGVEATFNGTDVKIYHKTGTLDQLMHDGGVVVSSEGSYVLTIYTDETDDSEDVRTSHIKDISKIVWDGYLQAVKE